MWLSIVILAVLFGTICNGEQSNGANTFLKSKLKAYFKAVDVDHSGVLSMADLEEARIKFYELYHSNNYTTFDNWWNECIMRGKTGEVTKSEFIADYDKAFSMDKQEFDNRTVQCQEQIYYDVIDTNKDKSISKEEHNIIMKVFGSANDVLNAKYFQSYDPVDNLIPAQTLINSMVDFETNGKSSKENKVKNYFDDAASER